MVAEVKAGASLAGYARAANPVREGTPCADLLLCRPPRAERFKRAVREYKWAEARLEKLPRLLPMQLTQCVDFIVYRSVEDQENLYFWRESGFLSPIWR